MYTVKKELFGDIDSYKNRDLNDSSSLYGDIKCPITVEEFKERLKQKKKSKRIRKIKEERRS